MIQGRSRRCPTCIVYSAKAESIALTEIAAPRRLACYSRTTFDAQSCKASRKTELYSRSGFRKFLKLSSCDKA